MVRGTFKTKRCDDARSASDPEQAQPTHLLIGNQMPSRTRVPDARIAWWCVAWCQQPWVKIRGQPREPHRWVQPPATAGAGRCLAPKHHLPGA
jgi:hypothetical protein